MNRRGFLASILASATAPYVCTAAGVLMPVKKILAPTLWVGSWESFRFIESPLPPGAIVFKNRLWWVDGPMTISSVPLPDFYRPANGEMVKWPTEPSPVLGSA